MTLLVTVVFKNRYGLKPSNGRCGGVVELGHARIIGNPRYSAPVTDVLLCNGLVAPITNAVLPIWGFHVVFLSQLSILLVEFKHHVYYRRATHWQWIGQLKQMSNILRRAIHLAGRRCPWTNFPIGTWADDQLAILGISGYYFSIGYFFFCTYWLADRRKSSS